MKDDVLAWGIVLAGIALFVGGILVGALAPGIVWFIVGPL